MHANQSVTASFDDFELTTGKQIEKALMDPKGALYQDLYNARMNAAFKKHNREKADYQYVIAKEKELAIEELEDELKRDRELTVAQYRESLEKYYADQHASAMKSAESGQNFNDIHFNVSLNLLAKTTQELVVTENQLMALENEHKSLLQQYASNQQACAAAFNSGLELDTTYIVDGIEYSLSIGKLKLSEDKLNKIPKEEQQAQLEKIQAELRVKQEETAATLANQKPFIEVIMALPEENDVRQLFEKGMIDNRPLLQRNVLIEIALTNFVKAYLNQVISDSDTRQVNRTSSRLVKQKFNELMPLYQNAQQLDFELHTNSRNTQKMMARQAVLQENISQLLWDLSNNQHIKNSDLKKHEVDTIFTISNHRNEHRGPSPSM